MPLEPPADSMFALRDALYVTSDAWGKEELHGIPWQCGGDAVFTPAVPVAQECTVHFRLRSMGLPAGVGAAHVWIKQGAAEFSHVGTLASASSRFAMKMEVPQVRIAILPCAGADAPRVPPTPALLGEAAPDSVASLLAEPMEVTKNESGLWDDDDDAEELPSLDVLRARQQVAAAAARRHPHAAAPTPPPPPPPPPSAASPPHLLRPQGRADLRKRSSSDATVFVAGEEGAAADAAGCEWDLAFWKGQPKESVCDFVLERLEEKNRWNVEAVVDELGAVAALRLLQHVERVQRDGGMTCAPRNSAAQISAAQFSAQFGRAML